MSAQDLEQRARELLAAEYEAMGDGREERAAFIRKGHTPGMDVPALRAIAAALRQQPAPAIIDNAGKVECVEHAKASVVYQLQDDLLAWNDTDEATFNWWRQAGGRNTRKLYSAPSQPAPVDDTVHELIAAAREIEQDAAILGMTTARLTAALARAQGVQS